MNFIKKFNVFKNDKKKFKDCKSIDEKIEWLYSEEGKNMLNKRPRVKELFENGTLIHMLNNPEWSDKINIWLSSTGFRQSISSILSSSSPSLSSNFIVSEPLSNELKVNLIIQGYVILRDFIPLDICKNAIKYINCSILSTSNHIIPDPSNKLTSYISNDINVLNLFHKSKLLSLINSLIHGNNNCNDIHIHIYKLH